MIKKILSWFLLSLLVAYVVAAAVWARGEAMKNRCKSIRIEIAETSSADSVTKKGVMAEIGRYPKKLVGERIPVIDTRGFEEYLKSCPQFEDVVCNFTTDGDLIVRVLPMVPELRVFEDSLSYYINKDGKKMNSKASFYVDVPVVSGNFNSDFTAKDLLPVTRFIENDDALRSLIGMVHADDAENILLIPRIQGHVVNFGDTTRLAEKRDALLAMYRKVMPYKGWNEYDTISVKFKGQVVATRRQKGNRYTVVADDDGIDMEEYTLPKIENTETQNQ